jgi:hypothetical protein
MPAVDTVAAAVLVLLQAPIVAASVRVMVVPTHKLVVPEMGPTVGAVTTVTGFVAIQEPMV